MRYLEDMPDSDELTEAQVRYLAELIDETEMLEWSVVRSPSDESKERLRAANERLRAELAKWRRA